MPRRKAVPFALLVALGLGGYFLLAPRFPKEQTVNIVLGDAAPKITDLTLRYVPTGDREPEREARFHFGREAPRIVHHDARLPDGDYRVEIDLEGDHARTHLSRTVAFRGGATSIDVSEAALSALAEAAR